MPAGGAWQKARVKIRIWDQRWLRRTCAATRVRVWMRRTRWRRAPSTLWATVRRRLGAFNPLNAVPSSANPFTLTQVLRKEWGFKGMVVSDWNSVGELVAHGIAADDATAARKAFLAGVDMDMTSSLYHDQLAKLVGSGAVPEAKIDESVRRVLRVKLALGLFEHPYVDEGRAKQVFFLPESLQLAQTVAERSFVLLRNVAMAGGKPLLPISKDVKTVAVIGPLADNPSDPEGVNAATAAKSGVLTFPAELARRLGE